MIEFNGYLTGTALKCLHKRYFNVSIIFAPFMYLSAMIVMTFIFFNVVELWVIISTIVPFYFIVCILIPLLAIKANKNKIVPQRISMNGDMILCITDVHGVDNRRIEQIKEVRDYDEYYNIIFKGLDVFPHFICQKNLLTKGSIDEFEALFEGKIKKMPQKK